MRRCLAVLLLCACGASDDAPTASIDRSAGERPDEVEAVLAWSGGAPALEQLRDELGPLLPAGLLPASSQELVERVLPLPPGLRVRDDAPVVVAAIGDLRAPEWVVAFRARGIDGLSLRDGGPRGSKLAAENIAVDETRVVVATTPEVLGDCYGWLAYGALAEDRDAGLHLELGPSVGGLARTEGDAFVRGRRDRALQDIAEERARRGAPALGDPEALVAWLMNRMTRLVAFLPDVERTRAHLLADGTGLHLRTELTVKEGTPLAEVVADDGAATVPLAALPKGTALAWWRAHPSSSAWSSLFVDAAGDRLSDGVGTQLRNGWQGAADPILAIGHGAAGPWALAGGTDPRAEAMETALASSYAQQLLGAGLGCDRADTRARNGRAPLCGDAMLLADATEDAWTMTIATEAAAPTVRWGERGEGSLGSDPDASRVLPEQASGVLFIDPTHVPGALRLLPSAPTPEARSREHAPIAIFWRSRSGEVDLEAHFAPNAAAHLAMLGSALGE